MTKLLDSNNDYESKWIEILYLHFSSIPIISLCVCDVCVFDYTFLQ